MLSNEVLQRKVEALTRENNILKKENKYLRRLTNSKRFKFAEKIATGYNGIFPKSTKRRNAIECIWSGIKKILTIKQRRQEKKLSKKISSIATRYDKVIVLNSIPWDTKLKQRPHHLATEFSKIGFFVVYLEYDNPLCPFREIKENLVTVNSEKYLLDLPKANRKCYLLSPNNIPTDFETLKKMKNAGFDFIYDYLDEFHEDISGDLSTQMEVWDKLEKLDPVLCTATASRLQNELKKKFTDKKKIILARNAVNIDHFNYKDNKTTMPPTDLRPAIESKKPIIGFYGALAPWIDFDLLNKLASKHHEWNFVYLGVDYSGAAIDLEKRPNVYNLGAKNYELLPKYAKFFNVAMIPFKRGEIAKATSPVKLFEYMAAGLPTVCTRDLKECEGYKYIYMSKDDNEFEENIKKALKDFEDDSKRQVLLSEAKENTWEARVKDISEALV